MKTDTLFLDTITSARLAAVIHARPQQCWMNAMKALPHLSGGLYVEGWLVCDGVPIEHGWCEWEGKVVDPTLYNRLGNHFAYFPGIKYTYDDVAKRVGKKAKTLPLIWHEKGAGFGGFGIKSYRDAHNQALRACGFEHMYD